MKDTFEAKLSAAARAGWKVLLAFAAILMVQYSIYLYIAASNGVLAVLLLGSGVSWSQIQTLWIWMMTAFKVCFISSMLFNLWISLWAKELRKLS